MMAQRVAGKGPPGGRLASARQFLLAVPKLLWHREPLAQLKEVRLPSTLHFLLAQAASPFSGGPLGALAHIGWASRIVLLTLVVFSFVSWAIIIYKGVSLRRAYGQSQTFLQVFRKSSKFSEVNSVCLQLKASPLVGVF